jgi:hypothetical protein
MIVGPNSGESWRHSIIGSWDGGTAPIARDGKPNVWIVEGGSEAVAVIETPKTALHVWRKGVDYRKKGAQNLDYTGMVSLPTMKLGPRNLLSILRQAFELLL